MEYYYDSTDAKYAEIATLNALKSKLRYEAYDIAKKLSGALFKNIDIEWTRRDTFGYIFTDFNFVRKENERLIGRGELDLFEKLKNDYFYVVLSRTLDRNFNNFQIDNKPCVVINLDRFQEFLSIIRDRTNTVRLFLYKFSRKEEEDLIRSWLRSYGKFEEIQKEAIVEDIDAMMDVIKKHKIEKPADLEKMIILSKSVGANITHNHKFFEDRLEEFKKLIDDDAADELKINNFLFDNIWIIDFQYMGYQKNKQESIKAGDTDLSLYNDAFGISRTVIIELKKATKSITTSGYRKGKPVILAEVGKAISQTIHYLENKKRDGKIVEGIVLIGRKKGDKDYFIEKFNDYLHGIKVLTYDDIYEQTKNVIAAFKLPIIESKTESGVLNEPRN